MTVENITATWQVISYDEKGVRKESNLIALNISLEELTILAVPATINIDRTC